MTTLIPDSTIPTSLIAAAPVPESPYRGIESFRYIDHQIFSAREAETWDLLSNILIYRGVLFYGDSGSGKTSLVNAGLIPVALKENLLPNRLRVQPRRGREIRIERIPVEVEDKPPYLPSTFIEDGSKDSSALSVEISVRDFYKRLKRLKRAPAGGMRPLLIFDQFEEFITLFEEALRGGETIEAKLAQKEAPEIQRLILKAITKLIEDDELPIKILFTFREDYFAKLEMLLEACPELLDQYVRLLPPRVEEAEKIIRAPFVDEEMKKRFTTEARGTEIPQELAKTIAVQLQGRSDGGFINLSELQIVCRKLSESADPVKFFDDKERKIQRVLEEYWSDVLKKLGDLYDPAIALLGHMVTSSNTRNIISEPDLKNHEQDNFTPQEIDNALAALIERKLVRREPRHSIYFYEIASEFLVPWIQEKKAGRAAEIEARRLAAEAEARLKQAEAEKRRLLRWSAVLGVILLLAVAAAVYMFQLRKTANEALQTAKVAEGKLQAERDRLDKIIALLIQFTGPDSKGRLQAVQALEEMFKNGELGADLAPVFLATIVNDKDPAVAQAASALLPLATEKANKDLTESLIVKTAEINIAAVRKLAPRFYIHISDEGQGARADKIAGELRKKGFTVPGYENVGGKAPRRNQLWYYESSDGPDPDEIVKTLRAIDGENWTAVALPPSGKARPGHFEIWFANAAPPPQPPTTGKLVLNIEEDLGIDARISNLRVTLKPIPPTAGRVITSNEKSIVAPAGKYSLTVRFDGAPDYEDKITIEAGEAKYLLIQVPKKYPQEQQEQQSPAKKKRY